MTIEEIKTQCRTCIELSEAATDGPWEAVHGDTGSYVDSSKGTVSCDSSQRDSSHIAHARTFAPAAAKALLRVLEWLETPRAPKKCPFCTEAEPCGSCYTLAGEDGVREAELSSICKQFQP